MEKFDLRDEIIDLLADGWGEPVDGRRLPRSVCLLRRYRQAMELPMTRRPIASSTIYGYRSVRVKKNSPLCRWDVYGVNPQDNNAILVCSVHWRLAFDDSEVWNMDTAGDVIAALQACIAFSPLSVEDITELRKKITTLPFEQTRHDTSRWVAVDPQDEVVMDEVFDRADEPEPERVLQESEFCLKRQISLD